MTRSIAHPMALIVYNRPHHLKRVIDSLRSSKPEPLFVFADGPATSHDQHERKTIKDQVRRINWTTPICYWDQTHKGLKWSVIGAVDEVLTHFDDVTVVEDDCVAGSHFRNFMERCLDKYVDCPSVMNIGGYTVPLTESILTTYPWDAYFFPRVEAWGWATWRRAWNLLERDLKSAYSLTKSRGIDLTQGGANMPVIVEAALKGRIDAWTPNWVLTLLLNRGLCVHPTRSHINNIGFDGSGVHCRVDQRFDSPLATSPSERFPVYPHLYEPIVDHVRGYYR